MSGTLQQSTRRPGQRRAPIRTESETLTWTLGACWPIPRTIANGHHLISNSSVGSPCNCVDCWAMLRRQGHVDWEAENVVSLDLLKTYCSRKHPAGGLQLGGLGRLRPAAR